MNLRHQVAAASRIKSPWDHPADRRNRAVDGNELFAQSPKGEFGALPSKAISSRPRSLFLQSEAFRYLCFQAAVAVAALAMAWSTAQFLLVWNWRSWNLADIELLLAGSIITAVLIRNLAREAGRWNPWSTVLLAWKGAAADGKVLKVQRLQEDTAEGLHLQFFEIVYQFQDNRGLRRLDCLTTPPVASAMRLNLAPGDCVLVWHLDGLFACSTLPELGGMTSGGAARYLHQTPEALDRLLFSQAPMKTFPAAGSPVGAGRLERGSAVL